jgi:hypothetical protein
MMTVKDLIDALNTLEDKNQVVVLSKDGEGNDFRELHQFGESLHVKGKWGQVEIYDREPDTDDFKAPHGAKPCIVLWPE